MPSDLHERQAPGLSDPLGSERIAADITVVMPVYNTATEHLDEAVGSILRQTVKPRAILIIDDGSTLASTRAALDALQDQPGVTLVRNERNLSLGPTMNRALRLCETPFALKLDSDDLARPQLVEKHADFLAGNRAIDVLGCQNQNFGASSSASSLPPRVTRDYVVSSRGFWFVNHSGVLLNRESVLAVNGYRRLRNMAEDYELWVRMMLRGYRRFYNLPDILVDYRDLPTGAHRNFRRGFNRGMLILLKTLMRACPRF